MGEFLPTETQSVIKLASNQAAPRGFAAIISACFPQFLIPESAKCSRSQKQGPEWAEKSALLKCP